MTLSTTTIASFLDAETTGPTTTIETVAALDQADEDALAYCVYDDPTYIQESDAGAILCESSLPSTADQTLIRSPSPKLDFIRVMDEFFTEDRTETTVHPTAWVADEATIGEECYIGPNAVIGANVCLADRVDVQAGAVIGTPGFGYERDDDQLHHQPHTGSVVLDTDVTVGPNTSIDRAVFDTTFIGEGSKLSGNVHVAHQVEIGEAVTVAYNSGFAGGATVGDQTTVHPHVSVATDIEIGPRAELGTNAAVLDDVAADTLVVGSPATPVSKDS